MSMDECVSRVIATKIEERFAEQDRELETLRAGQAASATTQSELAQSLEELKKSTAHVSAELARLSSLFDQQTVKQQNFDALRKTVKQLKLDQE